MSVQEPKVLTLHQLQELIREIFRTKKEFDVKNMNAGIPRETMEQYLYTYLTNKYGLKVGWDIILRISLLVGLPPSLR